MIEDMQRRNDYSFNKLARIVNRKKVNLKDFNYLVFPINQKHYHWFLIAVDL